MASPHLNRSGWMSDNVKFKNLSTWLEIFSHLGAPKCSCVRILREGNMGKRCDWLTSISVLSM